MIVLDANVLIAHLDGADVHHERAEDLLTRAAEEAFAASALTLAEVLVGPTRAGRYDQAVVVLGQLQLDIVQLPLDAPRQLALLRAGTALKMPDCCVVLAADQIRGAVATFDQRLAMVARQRGLRTVS